MAWLHHDHWPLARASSAKLDRASSGWPGFITYTGHWPELIVPNRPDLTVGGLSHFITDTGHWPVAKAYNLANWGPWLAGQRAGSAGRKRNNKQDFTSVQHTSTFSFQYSFEDVKVVFYRCNLCQCCDQRCFFFPSGFPSSNLALLQHILL